MLLVIIIGVIALFTLLAIEAHLKKINKQNEQVITLLSEIKDKVR